MAALAAAMLLLAGAGGAGALGPALAPAASVAVSGTATDSLGHPLSGWTIRFSDSTDAFSAVTDAAGHYSLDVDAGEAYALRMSGPDLVSATAALAPFTSATTVDLTLPVVTATVSVTDGQGQPVVGAQVIAQQQDNIALSAPLTGGATQSQGSDPSFQPLTDASGSVTLTLLEAPGVTDRLTIDPPSGSTLGGNTVDVTEDANSSSGVVLSPGVVVSGTAKDSKGDLLGGFEVDFETATGHLLVSAGVALPRPIFGTPGGTYSRAGPGHRHPRGADRSRQLGSPRASRRTEPDRTQEPEPHPAGRRCDRAGGRQPRDTVGPGHDRR